MQKPLNDNNGISPCIVSHYYKAGYSDIINIGAKERCNCEIAVISLYCIPGSSNFNDNEDTDKASS